LTLFNFSKWIAKQVTGPADRDMKIYIIGPPGSGKSKTALSLALKTRKWLSWCVYKDFKHEEEFFKIDGDHMAVIDSDDLFKMMTKYPPMHQIRIVDDCGNTEGFNSRRSMSEKNVDINSIWSTNRTRHCITIVTLHDTAFNDKRQVLLADIIIDLRKFYQVGRYRMAKLYRIRMGESNFNRGVNFSRFMTYERGTWITQESIACEMPPADVCKAYDDIRAVKDKANTEKVFKKYEATNAIKTASDNRPKCPNCGSVQLYFGTRDTRCNKCGKHF
jgi:hypothetical protein